MHASEHCNYLTTALDNSASCCYCCLLLLLLAAAAAVCCCCCLQLPLLLSWLLSEQMQFYLPDALSIA